MTQRCVFFNTDPQRTYTMFVQTFELIRTVNGIRFTSLCACAAQILNLCYLDECVDVYQKREKAKE